MSEEYPENLNFDNFPTYEELVALPHAELAEHAFQKQNEILRVRSLLSSIARLQQRKEIEHESEIIELEATAEKDPLTGLLNKRAWISRMETMISDGETDFGVVFIDLSRFKLINDTYDHIKGDDILKKTAEVIDTSLRHQDDFVAVDTGRYGGDEFAILCDLQPRENTTLDSEDRLQIICNRLRSNFLMMTKREGLGSLNIDAAIGFAIYEDGMTAEDLLRKADKAMYADKYARSIDLTFEETIRLKSVKHILDKAGVRLPDGILESD